MAAVIRRRKTGVQHYIVNVEITFQWEELHNRGEIEVRRIYPQEVKLVQKRFL